MFSTCRTIRRKALVSGFSLALMVAVGAWQTPAYAILFDWSYSDTNNNTGSGTLTVTGATSPFTMTAITGTYDGSSINSVPLPPGTCCGVPGNNNLVYVPPSPAFLDLNGIGFSTASLSEVNIFFDKNQYAVDGASSGSMGAFTLTAAPEPASLTLLAVGLAGLGMALRGCAAPDPFG